MIYLCIPAYNEEQTVGVVLWKIRQVLTDFPRDYQILVADDASTDRTAEVLAPYARVLPLTVLRARERRGYAASLEMLLREAVRRSEYPKRDTIVTLQADFTDEPEDVVPLIKKIEQGADIVGGTRASDRRPELLERLLLGWQQRVLRRGTWPADAGDPLSGFRSYRVYTVAKALEDAKDRRLLHWDGAVADAELLRATAPHARRVDSIDLVFRPDRRQRATRSSNWERLKGLRRFARGAAAIGTVPLTDLSPETVPPPRPLEIERERRSEATAEERNGRNGRNGNRRPARGGSGRGAPSGGVRTRPERQRRERPATAQTETPEKAQRRRRKPAGSPQGQASTGTVAPDAVASGNQGTEPAGAGSAAPRKRRRRRRRKSTGNGAASAPQAEAAETGTNDVSPGTTETSDAGAVADEATGAEGAPKKRRRRGGRRGGRNRRRSATPESGAAAGADGGDVPDQAPEARTEASPPAARDVEHVSVGERNDHD